MVCCGETGSSSWYVHVPFCSRFTPTQAVKRLKGQGWTLGKVIDLTFTKRYYDAQVITCKLHVLIQCVARVA